MRGNQVEFLTKKLNLTPDQVTQVKAIDADAMSQMNLLRSDTSLTPDEKKPKMRAIHQASQDKIRALLTDDQKTKYDAMLQAQQNRRGQGGPGGAGRIGAQQPAGQHRAFVGDLEADVPATGQLDYPLPAAAATIQYAAATSSSQPVPHFRPHQVQKEHHRKQSLH